MTQPRAELHTHTLCTWEPLGMQLPKQALVQKSQAPWSELHCRDLPTAKHLKSRSRPVGASLRSVHTDNKASIYGLATHRGGVSDCLSRISERGWTGPVAQQQAFKDAHKERALPKAQETPKLQVLPKRAEACPIQLSDCAAPPIAGTLFSSS